MKATLHSLILSVLKHVITHFVSTESIRPRKEQRIGRRRKGKSSDASTTSRRPSNIAATATPAWLLPAAGRTTVATTAHGQHSQQRSPTHGGALSADSPWRMRPRPRRCCFRQQFSTTQPSPGVAAQGWRPTAGAAASSNTPARDGGGAHGAAAAFDIGARRGGGGARARPCCSSGIDSLRQIRLRPTRRTASTPAPEPAAPATRDSGERPAHRAATPSGAHVTGTAAVPLETRLPAGGRLRATKATSNGGATRCPRLGPRGAARPAQPHQPETGAVTADRTPHRRVLAASQAPGAQLRNGGRSQHARRSSTPKLLLSLRQRVRLSAAAVASDGRRTMRLHPGQCATRTSNGGAPRSLRRSGAHGHGP